MNSKDLTSICDRFLGEAMEYNDLPGLVIGVSCRGETFTGARGVRDILTKDPLREDDIFHCASVSKTFTASSIMKLVEIGVLSLEDRLCDILPDLSIADRRYEDIRLWQMLCHTSGMGDIDDYHWEEALTGEDALSDFVHSDEVTRQPLLWQPGEGGFRYSNNAYEILGHIVAVKSGMSYEAFVEENMMVPAGMDDSTMLTFERIGVKAGESCPLITEAIRKRNAETAEEEAPAWRPMVLPHEKAEDRSIVPVKYYPYTRSHGPSSTLTSTAADLLKWGRAQMRSMEDGTLLAPDTYQHILHEYAEVPNNREKMGLGWFMRRQHGYRFCGHEGTDDGFRASFWICPDLDLCIVVLANLSGAPVKKLNKQLFDRMNEGE